MDHSTPPLYLHAPLALAASADDTAAPLQFSGLAYSGGPVDGGGLPMVIDLAATEVAPSLPLLYEHAREDIIGVIDRAEKTATTLSVAGSLFADIDDRAARLAKKARRGVQWQMSVGLFGARAETLSAGQTLTVNDQPLTGPAYVLRGGLVREVSIVALGADAQTNARFFSALPAAPSAEIPAPNTQDESMSDVNPLQVEVDALRAQVADLSQRLTDAETRASTAESAKAEIELAARKSEVAALFLSLGREVSDEALAPYIHLSADAWQLLAKELKALSKPAPDYLFSAQAQGQPAPKGPSLNPFDIYAARRMS